MKKVFIILTLIFNFYILSSFEFETVGNAELEPDQFKWKNFYLLTPIEQYALGAIWAPTPLPDFHSNFMIDIVANFGWDPDTSTGQGIGADGITFIFHRDPNGTNAIGGHGLAIGYGKMPDFPGRVRNSLTLEFDTHYNSNFADDIMQDHADIRFDGDLTNTSPNKKSLNSNYPSTPNGNIEDLNNQYINVYWFPDSTTGVGHLKVYFNCEKIYDFENYNIRDTMQPYMSNWDTGDIYYGLTAATGDSVNYHRVKVAQELALSQEPLCNNVQLYADFPSMCGRVTYSWEPAEYLDNPTSANPIARRSGVYTCTIGFTEDTSEVIQDYLSIYSGPLKDSISVNLGDKPDYSFSRAYGNSYLIDGVKYQTDEGICGSDLGLDCGYIISGWTEYRSDLSINEASSAGILLLKTDDYGEIQWSRNYINQGSYDLLGLTNQQKESIGFNTITHKIMPDYILRSNLKDDEKKGNSDDGSEVLIRSGYFAAGESKVSNSNKEALFTKFDLDGNLISSLNLKSSTHNLYCYELKNLADFSYLAVINRNIGYSSSNSILLSKLDYAQEKLDTAKNILLNINAGNSIFSRHYSLKNILNSNSDVKIKNYEYEHIFAFGYLDSIQQDRIGILILNDINISNSSNIIKKQISVKDYSGKRSSENIKIIYDSSFVNKFYILNSQQLSEIDFDGNEIQTIKFDTYIGEIADAKYDRERNLIIFNNINLWSIKNFLLYEFSLSTNQLKVKTFNDEYKLSDNLNLIENGFAITASCIIDSPKSDIFFTQQKNEYDDCSSDSIASVQIVTPTIREESIVYASVPNDIIAYEPNIIELDHQIIDKGYLCVDLPVEYCEGCDNIGQNSFELELFKVENEGSLCCYDLYIKNNSPCNIWGFDFELKYLLSEDPQIYHTELIPQNNTLYKNGRLKIKKICKQTEGLPEELEIRLKHNGSFCQYESENLVWKIDLECDTTNCCDDFEIVSITKDTTKCCSNILEYTTQHTCFNNTYLEIWDSDNFLIFETEEHIQTGNNKTINIDLNPDLLDMYEDIKIVIRGENGNIICIKDANLNLENCGCPQDIDSWVTLSSVAKEPPCSENECKITGEFSINITDIENCYTLFNVNDSLMHPIVNSNGSIPSIQFSDCIKQGTEKEYTFKFFKDINDTTPCEVTKTVGCLYEDFAQPCTPDCDTVDWKIWYLDSLDLPGCHGCKARIKYASRINTCVVPNTQDIQILAMTQYTDGPDSLACQNCMLTSAEMYKEAMLKIIHTNAMGFFPRTSQDTCESTWRIVNGACWALKFYNTGQHPPSWFTSLKNLYIVWLPCDDTECCAMNLRVCREDNSPNPDRITVDTLGYSGGSDSCSILEKIVWIPHLDDYDTLQCNEMCFWISQVSTEGYFGKQSFMIENEIEEFIKSEKLLAKMTQYENLLDFDLLSEFESDDVKISIHSLQGQSIIENYYTLKKGKNHYHFHIDKLQSGFYFITIQIDGTIQKTEKIIILR